MKKRLCAALLCCLLLCSCSGISNTLQVMRNELRPDAPLAAIPYIDPGITTTFTPQQSTFYYDQLTTEAARQVYAGMLYHLAENTEGSLYLKGDFSRTDVTSALRALQYDYPQLLCASWGQSCSYYSTAGGTPLGIEIAIGESGGERATRSQSLKDKVSQTLATAAGYADLYEREQFLHDTLITQVAYDYRAAKSSSDVVNETQTNLSLEDRLAHTAYGAIVSGMAVCDGYASAFQLLCNYAGIEAATVLGRVDPRDGIGGTVDMGDQDNHAWNFVRMEDGAAYYCDPTWDDNGDVYLNDKGQMVEAPFSAQGMRDLGAPVLHRYFNLNYEEISRNHIANSTFVYPQDTAATYGYYLQSGKIVENEAQLLTLAQQARQTSADGTLALEFRSSRTGKDASATFARWFETMGGYSNMFLSTPENGLGCYFIFLY